MDSEFVSFRFRFRKNRLFILVTLALVFLVTAVIAEVSIRLFAPQESLYPRYKWSSRYGYSLFPNTQMKAVCPGKYEYTYTINKNGFRGRAVPVSNRYDKTNILLLGDSNTFGAGVGDSETYAAVMQSRLGDCCNVINLGVPATGLGQQVRLFYEYGIIYRPEFVVILFCHNDLADNVFMRVTTVEDGRLQFNDLADMGSLAVIKKYLSRSIIQKSQLYNFVRFRLFDLLRRKSVAGKTDNRQSDKDILLQDIYIELLETFARDLKTRNTNLVMISVNGQLQEASKLYDFVLDLDGKGLVEYHEVVEWFMEVYRSPDEYSSPEGHPWGVKGHKLVGERLAGVIESRLAP
ncbi:MAG: SGNH/GDSL hydrolase family protein [Gemmatimonadota bacterium]|nr:SGNH/GDSL hydrolase family protein [Gemmatimonadota bacterium]